jgi:spore maturation protein CgeB
MRFTFIGLSITSSWGNGHATTYRALLRALHNRGHQLTFLERDRPWYADNRDMPRPPFCRTHLYSSLRELNERHERVVRDSDVVIIGSYVPKGIRIGQWVLNLRRMRGRARRPGITAFYDIDTPVTLSRLQRGECSYLAPQQIAEYDLYLSFTGGPTLRRLERDYGSPMARALYCSVDPELYRPHDLEPQWDLGYLGTYSPDRQPGLTRLLVRPARQWPAGRFVVAGPQYPAEIDWPANVQRIEHLGPNRHPRFYSAQRFTLNITRADMRRVGWSPSVRLFEAAACGVPIISDRWAGLDELLLPDREICIVDSTSQSLEILRQMPERRREAMGRAARKRILAEHTADHRAAELERWVTQALNRTAAPIGAGVSGVTAR